MSIIMACIDHHTADIALREGFSFTTKKIQQAELNFIKETAVSGAVLLCTCNRTELYLSCEDDETVNPSELICREAGVGYESCRDYFIIKKGMDAIRHLMEVASGLQSEILGEDQILSQIKDAAKLAWEVKSSDHELATLFRIAVTAGKKIKTEVRLNAIPASAASSAVELLKKQFHSLDGKLALVIGNGKMGQIAASLLVEQGCIVTVTLRTYKHGETVVPSGCHTVEYDKRLEEAGKSDIIISATTSPHFTLTKEMISELSKKPEYIIDLAVPRDIDPQIASMHDIRYYNIDTIGTGSEAEGTEDRKDTEDTSKEIEKCNEILEDYLGQYNDWLNVRQCIPIINEIKDIVSRKVNNGRVFENQKEAVDFAVDKTTDILIYAMKNRLNPEILSIVKKSIET